MNSFHRVYATASASVKGQVISPDNIPNFDLNLPSPHHTFVSGRMEQLKRCFEILLNNFENIYPGMHETKKSLLKDFEKWAGQNLENFLMEQSLNRVIPGQISVNDHLFIREHVVLISETTVPDFTMLLNFSALSAGSGVLVLATTTESFQAWSKIIGLVYLAGISKKQVEIYAANDTVIKNVAKGGKVSAYLLDVCEQSLTYHLQLLMKQENHKLYLPLTITPFEHGPFGAWEQFIEQFVFTRSLAINTMRHGAPLTLE